MDTLLFPLLSNTIARDAPQKFQTSSQGYQPEGDKKSIKYPSLRLKWILTTLALN